MYDSPKVPESFLWPSAAKNAPHFFFLNKLIMCLKHVFFLSEVWGSENKIVLYHRCQCMFRKCLRTKCLCSLNISLGFTRSSKGMVFSNRCDFKQAQELNIPPFFFPALSQEFSM